MLGESSLNKAQEVRDKLDPVRSGFPAAVGDPQVLRFSLDSSPIMSLAVRSDTMTDRDLTALAKNVIAKRIANIPGVGSATVVGGTPRQLNVNVDPFETAAPDRQTISALQGEWKSGASFWRQTLTQPRVSVGSVC
uniref:efflux RND transporter permease subunit n=1 Tax=Devosia sp. XK-2 TaxID=3126689 RepID=UPI00403FABD8